MPLTSGELIVVANRQPYRHERGPDGKLVARRSPSGVVNAVEPMLLERSGVWIAEGASDEDREASQDRDGLAVPTHDPRYRLRHIWLSPEERQGYYYGFANGALWPLCHRTAVEPVFYATDFHAYEIVNRRFADAVSDEAVGLSPTVLVQDYHFALAPALIRRQLPGARVSTFWHIPWPRPETFSICPWSRSLLEGLLGSTSIGFQTAADRAHFFAAAEQLVGAAVNRDENTITHRDRVVSVGVFPASVVWAESQADAEPSLSIPECRASVRRELELDDDVQLGVGVDRLDYTKGIEHKFLAIERLLERRPGLVGRFVFAQLAEPSRECLRAYCQARARVMETAARVNDRFSAGGGPVPIRVLEAHHPAATVTRFLRAASFCHVGSLHDGMNLVSKEFVRARDDYRGVLILSAFAGAAQELAAALVINPYDIDAAASAVDRALTMPLSEQRERMRRLRAVVARANAGRWASDILSSVAAAGERPLRRARKAIAAALAEPISEQISCPPLAVSDASAS